MPENNGDELRPPQHKQTPLDAAMKERSVTRMLARLNDRNILLPDTTVDVIALNDMLVAMMMNIEALRGALLRAGIPIAEPGNRTPGGLILPH